jgi:hypothetical protein
MLNSLKDYLRNAFLELIYMKVEICVLHTVTDTEVGFLQRSEISFESAANKLVDLINDSLKH